MDNIYKEDAGLTRFTILSELQFFINELDISAFDSVSEKIELYDPLQVIRVRYEEHPEYRSEKYRDIFLEKGNNHPYIEKINSQTGIFMNINNSTDVHMKYIFPSQPKLWDGYAMKDILLFLDEPNINDFIPRWKAHYEKHKQWLILDNNNKQERYKVDVRSKSFLDDISMSSGKADIKIEYTKKILEKYQ